MPRLSFTQPGIQKYLRLLAETPHRMALHELEHCAQIEALFSPAVLGASGRGE